MGEVIDSRCLPASGDRDVLGAVLELTLMQRSQLSLVRFLRQSRTRKVERIYSQNQAGGNVGLSRGRQLETLRPIRRQGVKRRRSRIPRKLR